MTRIARMSLALCLLTCLFAFGSLAFGRDANQRTVVKSVLTPASLENVSLGGHVGRELDLVVQARIRSALADEQILPEAIVAFRNQVDDRMHPGRGLWQGEFWGKWMLSAVAAQRYMGDPKLKALIRRGVDELIDTQREDGYLGTYHDSASVEGNVWNVWCQKYTLWGLLDAYELLGDKKILDAARRHIDHLMTEVGPGGIDIVKTGNFFGLPSSSILTPLLKLYRHTNDERYLDYARYIVAQWSKFPGSPPDIVNQGLTGKPVHTWFPEYQKGHQSWTKAYEFISCVEGLLDLYEVDGNETYLQAAKNVYDAVRENERVITGGIGKHDKLDQATMETDGLNEPCDVVYWERLSAKLLQITGEPRYADEIERLTYNVLLASMNREGSWGLRRLGLSEPHLISPLHCSTHHHHCCVANVPRGLLQLAEVAIMSGEENESIVVNLFIPGRATVTTAAGTEITLETKTDYPESGVVRFRVKGNQPARFALKVRIPPWSAESTVQVNDEQPKVAQPGTYTTIDRIWQLGDQVELNLDMRGRAVPFPGKPPHVAIMRGPVVLARSTLFGKQNVDASVALKMADNGVVPLKPVAAPNGIWMAFEAATTGGEPIQLCDYASTGKDYRKPTDPKALKEMAASRTATDHRVWLPTAE